jgi:shikimate dehydrogenase
MTLTGRSLTAGVLGWPVAHSRSPRLHGFWLERYGIDGAYLPLPVAPDDFAAAVPALGKLGFQGANVTVPHKEAAAAVCGEIDDHARRLGAVNTLVFRDGRIAGANTDGVGFLNNLRQGAPDWDPAASPAVVLGAGGSARAVAVALLEAGAPEVRVVNRTRSRAETLAADLGGAIWPAGWDDAPGALADAGLLVNTTSLGMAGQPPLELDLTPLPETAVVNDIVYQPLETDLLARARARGHRVVDGLGMLLHQAVPGFEAWFGVRPEVTPALRDFVLAA